MELTDDQMKAVNIIVLGIQSNRLRRQLSDIEIQRDGEISVLTNQKTQEKNDFIALRDAEISSGVSAIHETYQSQLDDLNVQLTGVVTQSETLQNS
jgi:hypothetical protein